MLTRTETASRAQRIVIDRTMLVLDIFAQHATTVEAKLQVSLAGALVLAHCYPSRTVTVLMSHSASNASGYVSAAGPGGTGIGCSGTSQRPTPTPTRTLAHCHGMSMQSCCTRLLGTLGILPIFSVCLTLSVLGHAELQHQSSSQQRDLIRNGASMQSCSIRVVHTEGI